MDECITVYNKIIITAAFKEESSWLLMSRKLKVKAPFNLRGKKFTVRKEINGKDGFAMDAFNNDKHR